MHEPYIEAFSAALRPVFVVATVLGAVAFALTWMLREVPLRKTTRSEGIGESFASPRDDSSFRELERSLSSLARRENRWDAYEQFAVRAGIPLEPSELWLLVRIGELEPVNVAELRAQLRLDEPSLSRQVATLESRSLVTNAAGEVRLAAAGMQLRERARATRSSDLNELLAGWEPERHAEIRRIVDELAHSFASEVPKRTPAT